MIGERIKTARLMNGLSLRTLAKQVGVSHQAIFKYENNQDIPGSEILIALASALDVKPEFFFRRSRSIEIKPAFRKRSCVSAKAENKIMGKAKESLERRLDLEALALQEQVLSYPLLDIDKVPNSPDQIEETAENLRRSWGLASSPISNLTELLEDRNVRVQIVDGVDSGFDACGFWIEECSDDSNDAGTESGLRAIPVIAIRPGVSGDRQRFSLAHELGHLVVEYAQEVRRLDEDNRSALSTQLDVEEAANRFAAAFLVPRTAALRELGSSRQSLSIDELHLLKHKYGFSIQAWIRRAMDLSIIRANVGLRLLRLLNKRGFRIVEPGRPVAPEWPTRAKQIALAAVAEGVISRAKAAELLGVPVAELLIREV